MLVKQTLVFLVLLSPVYLGGQETKRPLTVTDAIQAHRVVTGLGQPVLLSPDGSRYMMVLQREDLVHNGTWVDILCGSTSSLEASDPQLVLHLFTRSTAESRDLMRDLRWLPDSEHLAFLWDDGEAPAYLVTLNVRTRTMKTIARGPTPILQYDLSKSGNVAIYTARRIPDESEIQHLRRGGFAVEDQPIWLFLACNSGDVSWLDGYDTFVMPLSHDKVVRRKVVEPDKKANIDPGELLTVSPDGRYAIAVGSAPDVPAEWDLYTEHIFRNAYLPAARKHSGDSNWIRQYQLIDIEGARSQVLWNAPTNPGGNVVWSPDGNSVAVGPTFLPVKEADAAGLDGRAVAVIDLSSGNLKQLPIPIDPDGKEYRPVRWNSDGTIELSDYNFWNNGDIKFAFRHLSDEWRQVAVVERQHPAPIRIELRQDPNTSPRLFAVDVKSRRERMIFDVNPELRDRQLGRVEAVHWTAKDGNPWTGMLYYPVHYKPNARFPLVIQTHGYSSTEFVLDGPGALTTAYAAQPLANIDIAVLQVGGPDSATLERQNTATPREPQGAMSGYLGAIDHLVSIGIVDRNKVGLLGFSRTGWQVEYTLTHSSFPFAAAIAADNMNPGYFEFVLGDNAYRSELEADLGSAPFGKGLESFIREAPGFNVDKIQTPLRIELDSGPMSTSVLSKWELFSLLKYLGKPVELFLIPDIQHGVHSLQNPAQRLASLSGTVDWFAFWLKGEEDPNLAKTEQYARWRKLRTQQKVVGAVNDRKSRDTFVP